MKAQQGYLEVRPRYWGEVVDLCYCLSRWLFRGQRDASWKLAPKLHRMIAAWYPQNEPVPEPDFRRNREEWILHQFKRRSRNFLIDCPPDDDWLEWLALVQHYGGPTRLLDFSHSCYVACHFALEMAVQEAMNRKYKSLCQGCF